MPVIAERRSGNERFKFLIVGHPHGSVTSSVASTRTPSATRIGHCMGGESCPKQVLYDTFSAAKADPEQPKRSFGMYFLGSARGVGIITMHFVDCSVEL